MIYSLYYNYMYMYQLALRQIIIFNILDLFAYGPRLFWPFPKIIRDNFDNDKKNLSCWGDRLETVYSVNANVGPRRTIVITIHVIGVYLSANQHPKSSQGK